MTLVPSLAQREFLDRASGEYHRQMTPETPAVEYLSTRGITLVNARSFRLGYVESPLAGHEKYEGMLCIPYLTRTGVVTLRFRRIDLDDEPKEGPKYRSLPGDTPRIYNPESFFSDAPHIAICEGELDTMTAVQAGIPAVGIQGVSAWRDFYSCAFSGYERIFILADSDDKGQGMEFAEKVQSQLHEARIIPMPAGHDVNSFYCENGPQALRDKLELK